jgi:hypothetical protein
MGFLRGGGEVTQIIYTRVSKCKNDKTKKESERENGISQTFA